MTTELGSQIAVAAASTQLIEFLKGLKWFPLVSQGKARLNQFFSAIIAGAAASGIHCRYDHDTGSVLCAGVTGAAVGHFMWTWFVQFCIQHGWYKTVVLPDKNGAAKPPMAAA